MENIFSVLNKYKTEENFASRSLRFVLNICADADSGGRCSGEFISEIFKNVEGCKISIDYKCQFISEQNRHFQVWDKSRKEFKIVYPDICISDTSKHYLILVEVKTGSKFSPSQIPDYLQIIDDNRNMRFSE